MSVPPATPLDNERPPSLARGMWARFAIAGALILLMSGAATATFALTKLNHIAHEVFPRGSQIHVAKGVVQTAYSGEPQTFLIIGSDRRADSKDAFDRNNPPHSDTLLLVHLDPETGQTSVLSVPRDLLVTITTKSGQIYYPRKVNAAYTIGSLEGGTARGAELVAETIEHLLRVKLNGVIDVTFKGFIDVVDTLGCVYVNVDHRYLHENNGSPEENYSEINLQPGYQKLCYEKALSYVRYRHDDSDFVRVARQQDFIRDLREQVPASNLIGEIDKVSKAVGKAVTSTFQSSASQLLELAKLAAFSQDKPLRQVKFRVENVDAMIGGESYVTSSTPLLQTTVKDFLYGHEQLKIPASSSTHPKHHHSTHSSTNARLDLYAVSPEGKDAALSASPDLPFRLELPERADRFIRVSRGAPLHAGRPAETHPSRLRIRVAAKRTWRLLRRRGRRLASHPTVCPCRGAADRRTSVHACGRWRPHPGPRLEGRESRLFRHQHVASGTFKRTDDRDRAVDPARALRSRELQPAAAAGDPSSAALTSASA